MAFDVVTAKQGKPHVTADQQALMQAGMLGKGRYALDALNNLACTMTDSNTLTVDTGGLMVDGRWVVNEAQTSFAIANGSQARFRKDLAVLEIAVDPSTGVTSLEEKVLQGATAATEDAAADPTYEAGDLYTGLTAVVPIARITLNGLTPTCTALLPSVADLKTISEQTKKLGDSVSQDTGWVKVKEIDNEDSYYVFEYRVCAKMAFVHVRNTHYWTVRANAVSATEEMVPQKIAPSIRIPMTVCGLGANISSPSCFMEKDGSVSFYFKSETAYFEAYACYVL